MQKPTLYLMIGYPGAGKTTIARYLHEITGAEQIWVDEERLKMFGRPTYAAEESAKLYTTLNTRVAAALKTGKSVIFDTDFRFRKDRDHMRQIASQNGATTKLIWVTTDIETSRQRATKDAEKQTTRILGNMTPEAFNSFASRTEQPTKDENLIRLNGVNVTKSSLEQVICQA